MPPYNGRDEPAGPGAVVLTGYYGTGGVLRYWWVGHTGIDRAETGEVVAIDVRDGEATIERAREREREIDTYM